MNTPPKPRRASAKAQREKLLDAASEMLTRGGPGALSLRKLAATLGISTMGVYTAFGGKEGLLAALYEDIFKRMATMQEKAPRPEDPLQWLASLATAYRRFALDHPAYYALMISATLPLAQSSDDEPVARGIPRQRAYLTQFDCIKACQDRGLFNPGITTEQIAAILWAAVHGHMSLELAGFHETKAEADRHFQLLAEATLKGLLAPQGHKAWEALEKNTA